jgi:hypothetical protein
MLRHYGTFQKATLAAVKPVKLAKTPRYYVRVLVGFRELLCVFFNADTLQEARAAERVEAMLTKYPNSRAVVSGKCTGALRDLPVVGEERQ